MFTTLHEGISIPQSRLEERRYQTATLEIPGSTGPELVEITIAQIADLFEMRLLLETSALRHALGKHTKVDFAKAEMALDTAATERKPSKLAALNWEFHSTLYWPSGHHMLLKTIEQFNKAPAFAEIIALSIVVRLQTWKDEHRELLQACRNGEEAEAVSVLDRHLTLACQDLCDVM